MYLALSIIVIPVWGQSSSVTLSNNEINMELNKTFPIERKFKHVTAFFTKPEIVLDSLDEKIEIDTLIRSKVEGKYLIAKGKIEGTIEYDDLKSVLQFRKPVLEEFKVMESDMDEVQQKEVSRIIRQSMGNNLPKIVLVDLNNLDLRFPRQEPSNIDVEPGGLSVTFE